MRKLLIVFFITSSVSFGQETWDDFSGEQKAFMFNICRRTEILKPELLHLFEFTDSIPMINDTLPNYKYIEREVVKDPDKLVLHTKQMARKPDGLVSDLATRYALWELDQALKYRNSELEQHEDLKPVLKRFEKFALEKIPQSAVTTLSNGDFVVRKAVRGYYEPALQTSDKMGALKNSGFGMNDQMLIVNAIGHAQEKYVAQRSFEIFKLLGGKSYSYVNFISAVGDGSGFSSLEGSKLTPYNKLLPDDRGLYRFNVERKIKKKTYEETHAKRPKPDVHYLRVQDVTQKELKTSANRSTVVHLDVYGYHPERQTTVVIQKGGASYVLFGKNENRLLSPDSTYGEGTTYWRLMWELEHVHIAELNEALYGKRGYEYAIDVYEKKIEKTMLLIKKTEYKLDKLRHKPEGPTKIKKKKFKKKDLETSDQSGTGHPTSALSKNDKKKNIEQNRLVHLNTLLENQKATLAKLKYEMEVAYFMLQDYKNILDRMQKNVGYLFMDSEQEGDIFTFDDGSTWNYANQDFTFKNTGREESYSVFHISFGKTVFSSSIDESMVHMLISEVDPEEKFTYQKVVARTGSTVAMNRSDSLQTMEIFQAILKKDMDIEMTVLAGGILGKDGDKYFRDSTLQSVPYNADNEEINEVWKYRATKDNKLNLSVQVWQDKMMPKEFSSMQKGYDKIKKKNPELTEIDYISAVKARQLTEQWLNKMKRLVPIWFDKLEDQAKINRKLNSISVKKVGFVNGSKWIKVPLMPSAKN